jgi:hypothetical protein
MECQMTTDEKRDFQKTALRRSIFNKHGLKYRGWQVLSQSFPQPQKFLDLASNILNSEIFSEEILKGVDRGALLFHLVWVALDYDINILGDQNTIIYLDQYFENIVRVAKIAQLGSVLEKRINQLWQDCQKKLSARMLEGKVPPPWTYIQGTDKAPPPKAHRLVNVFLDYVPPKIPAVQIASWTNKVLICLGLEPVPDRTLRQYISKEKTQRKHASE